MDLFFADREVQAEVCGGSSVCTRSSKIYSLNGQILSSCIKSLWEKCFGKNFSVEVNIDEFFHPEAVECQNN